MSFHLVALQNVLGHVKGEVITDAQKVAAYLEGEASHLFVKIKAEAEEVVAKIEGKKTAE